VRKNVVKQKGEGEREGGVESINRKVNFSIWMPLSMPPGTNKVTEQNQELISLMAAICE